MVDELLTLNPHKLSFSEASMRIMITPHFSPRTRLSMAGRMVISEVSDVDTEPRRASCKLADVLCCRDKGSSRKKARPIARLAPDAPPTARRERAPAAWRTEAEDPERMRSQGAFQGCRRARQRRRMTKMGYSIRCASQVTKRRP